MKEIIKWDKSLETGIRAFDEEHKFLVKTLNEIYNLLEKGNKDEAKNILKKRVVEYAAKHFKHEEEIMEKYGYPNLERHKKTHEIFVKTVIEKLLPEIEKGSEEDFRSALSFLVGWLTMHIGKPDKDYGEWFKEKGITIDEDPIIID
ncbi:bacteriohemerythrin [Methanotorris igneus]|uniref:Bacteriohemerythrin n=1 Tax=Methanotorris igneus (strain DSM 5666 / JCM 11834 / Kol 5) TaxID=880724 RepID=F6BEL1_METIK|nr:hemerythrin family protein [Methanotorris igneus]AEF95672.1 Bacteriohemerythrin [Methanotorris igneus Kol 5]